MKDVGRIAVIDLGTNSTRLLVAEPDGTGGVAEVERRTTVTRLGQGVDATGRLADDALERVHDCLAEYRRVADDAGAQEVVAVATSAVRDAENGDELVRAARERHGIEVRTVSGEEEARLSFSGATAGRPADEPVLVLDIGGGSTEYVVGRPGAPPTFHVSTRMGSVRLTERHLASDPPAPSELGAVAAAAREVVLAEVPSEARDGVETAVAVAGTPTSLAAVEQELVPYDPDRVHGHVLSRASCERMLARLAGLPVAERREVPGLHPGRAPTIVAGVVILVESMRACGLDRIEVSEADILHGAALRALA